MSFFRLLLAEIKSVLTNQAIMLTAIGGGLIYSFLYPQPYLNQIIKEQKIIVMDLDNSTFSKRFISLVNASTGVKIEKKAYNMQEVKKNIFEAKAVGYLLIPKDFYKNILLRKSPTISFGANASYFLIYGTVVENIFKIVSKLQEKIKFDYKKVLINKEFNSMENKQPIVLNEVPLFNPNVGYIGYVLPAVFVLILHQLMVIAAGILGASQNRIGLGYWSSVGILKLLLAKFLTFFIIFSPIVMYYFGFCMDYYAVSHLASIESMAFLSFILIFSAVSLGVFLGTFIKREELVTYVVLVSSLPLFFSAGFVWPTLLLDTIPSFVSNFIPVIPLIMSFLKVNQLGIDFVFIRAEIIQILVLSVFYFLGAWLILRVRYNK